MEYVVQAFKVLKNLVHAEAIARAQKTGFFVALLRGNVHIHVATQNVILTFWMGGWVKTLTL